MSNEEDEVIDFHFERPPEVSSSGSNSESSIQDDY